MHKYDACAVSESEHIVFLFCIAPIVERAVSPEKVILGSFPLHDHVPLGTWGVHTAYSDDSSHSIKVNFGD